MTLRSFTCKFSRSISALMLCFALFSQAAFAAPDSVNVNAADAETLAAVLDGVGLARAEAIVEYRQENGRFNDVYDLSNVKGIGDRTVELNEGRIRLTD